MYEEDEDDIMCAGEEEDYYEDVDLPREGSGEACEESQFGCCPDGITAAADADLTSCSGRTPGSCLHSEFGCCADGRTAALGPDKKGCPCAETTYGCCPDGLRPAAGSNAEGTHIVFSLIVPDTVRSRDESIVFRMAVKFCFRFFFVFFFLFPR